ncbi:ELFLESS ISOFORM B [Salix viminalis]|uniref:ELFLESS ISOFORM B n=1 Tax=Salix viminalis TaxID=40686 RepID=A0A9Q0UFC5_SALVM|nr:ELFLESS ISOFORM B [Salix viminalis]
MSGQTQGVKNPPPLRGYRRRKTVLDLNAPPIEGRDDEGTSTARIETPQGVQASHQRNGQGPSLPPTIDVDAFDDDDDDVIESSPRAFAQAKNNSRRAVVVDVESGRVTHNKRRRVPPSQTIINCDLYINLEGGSSSSSSKRENVQTMPPKEPTFNCPICLCPLVEEMSTKCGHIFCKTCISDAIKRQAKCPTCRKRVTTKELIRVFLPATS